MPQSQSGLSCLGGSYRTGVSVPGWGMVIPGCELGRELTSSSQGMEGGVSEGSRGPKGQEYSEESVEVLKGQGFPGELGVISGASGLEKSENL